MLQEKIEKLAELGSLRRRRASKDGGPDDELGRSGRSKRRTPRQKLGLGDHSTTEGEETDDMRDREGRREKEGEQSGREGTRSRQAEGKSSRTQLEKASEVQDSVNKLTDISNER